MIYHPHATSIIAEMLGDSARISGGSLTNAGAAAARVEKQVAGGNFDGDVKSWIMFMRLVLGIKVIWVLLMENNQFYDA